MVSWPSWGDVANDIRNAFATFVGNDVANNPHILTRSIAKGVTFSIYVTAVDSAGNHVPLPNAQVILYLYRSPSNALPVATFPIPPPAWLQYGGVTNGSGRLTITDTSTLFDLSQFYTAIVMVQPTASSNRQWTINTNLIQYLWGGLNQQGAAQTGQAPSNLKGWSNGFWIEFDTPVSAIQAGLLNALISGVRLRGSTYDYSCQASGGVGPYSYAWAVDGAPTGGNSSSLQVTFSLTGHTIDCQVTDSTGYTVLSNVIDVYPLGSPLIATISYGTNVPQPITVPNGTSMTFAVDAQGGDGTYSYVWYQVINGKKVLLGGGLTTTLIASDPNPVGNTTFTITCDVSDTQGHTATSNTITVIVTP